MFSLSGKKALVTGATGGIGAGKVLSGLMKRIEPEVAAMNVGVPADLEIFAKAA